MKLAVVGTGYVGLVTGATLFQIGQHVIYIDTDEAKVEEMRNEISPIYESRLSKLMKDNIFAGRLNFKCNHEEGFNEAIAVEMLENDDGSANLMYEAEDVATTIALTAKQDTIVVTQSTVPVGTNARLRQIIEHNKLYHINIGIVSNLNYSFRLNDIEEYVNKYIFVGRKILKPHLQVSLSVGEC